MGKNEAKTVYADIELICRDGVQVEKFRQLARDKRITPNEKLRKSDYVRTGIEGSTRKSSFFDGLEAEII